MADDEWVEITRVLRATASTAPVCLILVSRKSVVLPRLIFRGPARDHISQYGPRFRFEVARDGGRVRVTEDNRHGTFELSNRRNTSSIYLPAVAVWQQSTQRAVDCTWAPAGTAKGILVTIPREDLLAAQRGEAALPPPPRALSPPPPPPVEVESIKVLEEDPDPESYTPTQLGYLESIPIAWGQYDLTAVQRLLAHALFTRKVVSIQTAVLVTKIEGETLSHDAIKWHIDQMRDGLITYGCVISMDRVGSYFVPRAAQLQQCRRLNLQPPEV